LLAAWLVANAAWHENPTHDTERAVDRAADALRGYRHGEWEREGVTNALLRERFEDDEDDGEDG
jgi:hypothetical protein